MGPLALAFLATLPFPPDPFQQQALTALERGRSVLVTAPTGAGKTLVADFAASMAMAQGRGLIYTTPIKALSNQKYRQLCAQFGAQQVGLVTGDTVLNRTAPLLVMTTEIVRNLLVVDPAGLAGVGYLVFDEVHFLADPERGPVWEEAMVWAPPEVLLICLSATVSNAREIARWLETVHGPTTLITHDVRPVPLEDHLYSAGRLTLLRDAAGNLVHTPSPSHRSHHRRQGWDEDDEEMEEERPWDRYRRRPRTAADPALPVAVTQALRGAALLPAIYFRFSRVGVEEAAALLAGSTATADPPSEEVAARRATAVARTLADLDADARALPHTRALEECIARGVAFHHAGLIHPLKTLVEELFAAGALDVVCATGTLSMGLHLPARSVVLADLKKFNGASVEWLTATEYRQLTGRAGRRGIDTRGVAVLVAHPDQRIMPIARRLFGEPEALYSAFALRYNTFLNVYAPRAEDRLLLLLENSLSRYQHVQWLLRGRDLESPRSPTADQEDRRRPRRREGDHEQAEHVLRAELARGDSRLVRSMRHILEQEGCLDANGHLLLRGALAARLFNSWGITYATLLLDGSLSVLAPVELAEVTSWFISSKFAEPGAGSWRGREGAQRSPYAAGLSPHLAALADGVTMGTARLRHRELALEVELTPPWDLPNHRFVRAWCERGLLAPILEETGAPPGDVLQVLGQTLDLLRQGQRALTDLAGHQDPSARLLERAATALGREGKLLHLLGL